VVFVLRHCVLAYRNNTPSEGVGLINGVDVLADLSETVCLIAISDHIGPIPSPLQSDVCLVMAVKPLMCVDNG